MPKNSYDSFSNLFVPYQKVTYVEGALRRLITYGAGNPKTGKAGKLLLLTGPSRGGKTAILSRFLEEHPRSVGHNADSRDVIMEKIPEQCTIKDLLEALLVQLGDGAPDKGTKAGKLRRVTHHIREQRVQTILLDEGHHLIDSDSTRVLYSVSESIKSILNIGLCSVVLAGMPETEDVVEANPQLRGRLLEHCKLDGLNWHDKEEQKTFRLILHRFDQETPLPSRAGLGDPRLALRIWLATRGLVGLVAQLLETAVIAAIEDHADHLTQARLALAFDAIHSNREKANPFRRQNVSEADSPIDLSPASRRSRKTRLHRGNRRKPEMPI